MTHSTTSIQQQINSLQSFLKISVTNDCKKATSSILKKIHALEIQQIEHETSVKTAYKALDTMVDDLLHTNISDAQWSAVDDLVDSAMFTQSLSSDVWGHAK
jgi:uncharacterized protein YejL (UPF0352 family)